MKRCPQCNRTFTNDAQKFCTQDGVSLVDDAAAPRTDDAVPARAGQGETIRIEAPRAETPEFDDETTKQMSRDLAPEASGEFDPYKTLVSKPQDTATKIPANTGDLKSSPTTPPAAPPPTSALNPSTADLMKTMASFTPPPVQRPAAPPPPPPPPVREEPRVQQSEPLPQSPAPPLPMRSSSELPKTVPAPKKTSKLPLVLGILAVLFFLALGGAVAGYFLVLRPMLEAKRETPEATPTPAATPVSTPTVGEKKDEVKEPPPYNAPPDGVQFVNSIENLEGRLKQHYVDFSFYYPESWQKDPAAGTGKSSNFAKVERRLPPDFTQENFAVGSYDSAGSPEGDRAIFPTVAKQLSAQFEKSFDPYKKVSEGPTKVGVYDGYEFRFESFSPNTEKGDIKIWGRVIFLPPVDGSKNGVTLLMLATSLAPELKSVDDVGVKGGMPMMLESFRFGK